MIRTIDVKEEKEKMNVGSSKKIKPWSTLMQENYSKVEHWAPWFSATLEIKIMGKETEW